MLEEAEAALLLQIIMEFQQVIIHHQEEEVEEFQNMEKEKEETRIPLMSAVKVIMAVEEEVLLGEEQTQVCRLFPFTQLTELQETVAQALQALRLFGGRHDEI
jgi:hypothetical protein